MALTLISTHTASASASIDITAGITSTYDSYEFHFVNIHPQSDSQEFKFQVNAAGQAGFNETITSSYFYAYHNEADSFAALTYHTGGDKEQGTSYQMISAHIGNENDESCSGVLTLYAPSSTTYVKHFVSRANRIASNEFTVEANVAGYINTTSAIDEISFKMNSGNIDDGTIKMFGVS